MYLFYDLPMPMHAWYPQKSEDGVGSPWSWDYKQLWVAMTMMGTEPRSFAKTSSTITNEPYL